VCNGVDNCPVEPNADQASVNGVGVACQMQAITVPANPANPAVPHVTYSGASITLKGIARYGGDQFKWDFGDGSTSTDWTSITDRYALGVKHAYTGLVGQLFVATLSVHNSANPSVVATADYLVKIVQSSSIASVPSDPNQLDVRATMAIDEGLWRLHVAEGRGEYVDGAPGYNQPYGSWEGDTATSCVALDAFEVHGSTPEQSWRSDPYVEDARRGLTYLLANAQAGTIGQQVAGNPDFNGNGIGVHIGGRAAYVEGVCAIALADSGSPDRRAQAGPTGVYSESYKDIAQDTVDWFAWGQVEANGNGFGRGGWGYTATDQTSTNESLRWPILAMRAAEREMSATVPAFVRTELASYILRSQYRGLDSNNGGWGDFGTSDLMDVGFAASGLIAYEFVGNIVANPAPNVQAGLGFIYRHWTDNNGPWDANLGDSDAMYGVMQAMQNATPSILQIKNFDYTTGQQSANGFDWYHTPAGQTQEGVATNLVRRQASDGSWSDDSLGNAAGEERGSLWSTAWATIILNKEARPGAPVAPVADAGGPYSGEKNTPIALDASASFSSDGGPLTYSWDINGDGVFGDATGPTAVFHGSQDTNLADGTSTGVSYSVCVLVTDSHGGESTACAPVTVKPSLDSPPYASAGGPYTGAVGVPVQLDASASYDVDGDQLTYAWDLNNNGAFVDATGPNPTVTFAQPGSYAIGVKVTDSHGLSDTAFTTVTIGDHAPQASAGGPYSGRPGSPVTLDASGSSDPDGDPITYAWDLQSNGGFADSTQAKPTFTVPSSAIPGTALQVCVKVTDSFGRYDTACSSVTVVAPTVPPEVPTGLAAVASDGSVLLSWAAPTGATTYEVFRSADGGSSYVSLGSASTPSFVDSTVDRGARYDYAVSASNAGGASARSASSSVTLPPAPPTNLTAIVTGGSVALAWTGSAGATSYEVFRSSGAGGSDVDLGAVSTPSFGDSAVVPGETYRYVVSATNAGGASARSAPASVTLPLLPPSLTAPRDGQAIVGQTVGVAGVAAPGATVAIFDGGVDVATLTADAAGAFGGSVTLDYGRHSLSAVQSRDTVVSPASPTATVDVVPDAPRLDAPASVVGTSLDLAGHAVPGATVVILDGVDPVASSVADTGGDYHATLSLTYGSHDLRAQQTLSGETSAPSSPARVHVVPAAPWLTSPTAGYSAVGSSVDVAGLGVPGATISFVVDGAPQGTLTVGSDGTFAGTLSPGYGRHAISTSQSVTGEVSAQTAAVSIDLLPPAPAMTAPSVSRSPVAVSGIGAAGADLTVLDGGTAVGVFHVAAGGTYTGALALTDGSHTLSARQTVAGEASAESPGVSVLVDTVSPIVTYTGNVGTYSVDQMIAIQCAAIDDSSGIASSTCADISGPAYTFGVGSHTYTATATDKAGNSVSASTTFSVGVTPTSLCQLTKQFVQSSTKYQALPAAARGAAGGLANGLCQKLASIIPTLRPAQKSALVSAYKLGVTAFVHAGWLTEAQANTLKAFAVRL